MSKEREPIEPFSQGELPGELELRRAIAVGKWPHTMEVSEWVKQWMEQIAKTPEMATDEGSMIAWFANAIMAGYDRANYYASIEARTGEGQR